MESVSSNPDRDGAEEGAYDHVTRGEDESAKRESNDVQSSSPVSADTYSQLNRADDRPDSPGSAAYAVAAAQPMTYASSAAYEDAKVPGSEQSPAKTARQDTPSPPAVGYAEVKPSSPAKIEVDGQSPATPVERSTPSPTYASVNKSEKATKNEE